MTKNTIIPAVNFHVTKVCNMRCKYCFAKFAQIKKKINLEQQKQIIKSLSKAGFKKINFVGGEPLLIHELPELVKFAKELGFYVSIVTNGSLITNSFLVEVGEYIDLIGLSIDSLSQKNNLAIQRINKDLIPDEKFYSKLCKKIKHFNIDLKINTVVSKFNLNENFSNFINKVKPIRWKIFQVLEIKGENSIFQMAISKVEFQNFIENHKEVRNYIMAEDNNLMKGSYIMIDPIGRFFDNTKSEYTISEPITQIGVPAALSQIKFDFIKFKEREGDYFFFIQKK